MLDNSIILLTACVRPNGMSFTFLQDEDIRLQQYKDALKWYIDNTSLRIVLVENTLTDFSRDFQTFINNGRLEFITFDGNNYNRQLGKGYGEALIIQKALAESKFISESTSIIKITGRLIIRNINKIISTVENESVYTNTGLMNGKCLSSSYIIVSPISFFKNYFLPNIDKLNDSDGYYFEHLLYDSQIQWKKDHKNCSEFKYPIKVEGISGTSGRKYYAKSHFDSLKAWIKYYLHKKGIYINYIK